VSCSLSGQGFHPELSDVLKLLGFGSSRDLPLAFARPWCCCFFGFGMGYLKVVGFPNS
jgi:hypothetical protein